MAGTIGRANRFSGQGDEKVPAESATLLQREQDETRAGSAQMLFGTDHPFFPPLGAEDKWRSVIENLDAIESVGAWGSAEKDGVRGRNALKLFGLL